MVVSKRIFFLFTCLCSFAVHAIGHDYFSCPQLLPEHELSDMRKSKTLDMCWNIGENSHFRFVSSNDEIYFEICLGLLPDIYEDFLGRVEQKFIQNDTQQLMFSYKLTATGEEVVNGSLCCVKESHPDEYSYIVTERRILNDAHPVQLDQAELEEIIKRKKVIFYTGAGVSRASNVPTMNELNELLGLEMGERYTAPH